MKIQPKTKYDACRVARSLVNSRIPFTFDCYPLCAQRGDNPDAGMVITTKETSDKLVFHVFRNMDDIGALTPTDPLTATEVKRMIDALEESR